MSMSWGGQSSSFAFGTSAAGCASHVGYQKLVTSRRAWEREPGPPSKPSKLGGERNSVFIQFRVSGASEGRSSSRQGYVFLAARVLASKSSRSELSPLPQEPPALPLFPLFWKTDFAPPKPVLIAALASARWPLPIETPVKALTWRPGAYGLGWGAKLDRKS